MPCDPVREPLCAADSLGVRPEPLQAVAVGIAACRECVFNPANSNAQDGAEQQSDEPERERRRRELHAEVLVEAGSLEHSFPTLLEQEPRSISDRARHRS